VVSTPLDAVAKHAGVSKATLFFHFADRRALLQALSQELYVVGYRLIDAADRSTVRKFLEAYLAVQEDARVRLLWRVGDVLTADGAPLPGAAYGYAVHELQARLDELGVPPSHAVPLAGVVAPAALLMARTVAFDGLGEQERTRFLDQVDALVRQAVVASRAEAAGR
jgi:AcrR family transcriptional regulator